MNLGASEILLVVLIVLLLFGGKRLPELARSIGKGLAEFRRATQQIQHEINNPLSESFPDNPVTPLKPASADREQTAVHANPTAQPRISEKPPGSAS
jgi:sec-independent protein translocase protein TatA